MKSILVTGANGFLGAWVVRRLNEMGAPVKILARQTSDLSELGGLQYKIAYGDITDLDSLIQAMTDVTTVFHLAGVIAYKKSDRPLMEKVNVQGTANVIEAMKQQNLTDLVYLSSVVAIGAAFTPQTILNESSPFNIEHLALGYFDTKHAAEKLVIKAYRDQIIRPLILNPSTIYGPGDAKKGSRKTQLKVARGAFPFYTAGGVNVIAVQDCIDGIFSAWKRGRPGERYILAGENLYIRDLFKIIAESAGTRPPQWYLPTPLLFTMGYAGDLMSHLGIKAGLSVENSWTASLYHWFDSKKAQDELGLKTRPAREAIGASVQWMKEKGLLL